MKRHRHNKKKAETPVASFFHTILPFIEALEKEDHLLMVVPSLTSAGEAESPLGIVLDSELSNLCHADYLLRMARGTQLCGSLERFLNLRSHDPKFAQRHNPDQYLLNLCRSARYVMAYRHGIQFDSKPLLITMMDSTLIPQTVGFELAGEITLDRYLHTEDDH